MNQISRFDSEPSLFASPPPPSSSPVMSREEGNVIWALTHSGGGGESREGVKVLSSEPIILFVHSLPPRITRASFQGRAALAV